MAQKTDSDLQQIKDLIQGGQKEIDTKLSNMQLDLSDIKGELKLVNSRLTLLETAVTKLDNRLWTFGGIALSVTLGSLLTVFIRYIFSDSPKL